MVVEVAALINARNSAHDFSVKLVHACARPSWRNACNLLAHVIPSDLWRMKSFTYNGTVVSQ